MWLFVEKFGLHYMLAKIGATFIVMFWNYVMKRKAVRNSAIAMKEYLGILAVKLGAQ